MPEEVKTENPVPEPPKKQGFFHKIGSGLASAGKAVLQVVLSPLGAFNDD